MAETIVSETDDRTDREFLMDLLQRFGSELSVAERNHLEALARVAPENACTKIVGGIVFVGTCVKVTEGIVFTGKRVSEPNYA